MDSIFHTNHTQKGIVDDTYSPYSGSPTRISIGPVFILICINIKYLVMFDSY